MNLKLRMSIATAAVALATLGLAACSNAGDAGTGTDTSDAPIDQAIIGVWGDPNGEGEASLEFTEDGKVSGTDGCNRLTGGWEAKGDKVTLGPLASTKMFCEGVDTWLSGVETVTISQGQTLVVADTSGTEIGTLKRS